VKRPIHTIQRVGELLDVGRVPVQNSSEAVYSVDSLGRRWVRKRVSEMGHEALLAETLGWLLARHFSVPIPDAAVSGTGEGVSWLSAALPLVKHWGEAEAGRVRNLRAVGRALMLDAVLMNGDRHAGNILLAPLKKGDRMTAWAIDFDHALVGWPGDYAAVSVDGLPSLRNLARGLPVAHMRPGARQAAREARLLDAGVVAGYVTEACEIAGEPRVGVLAGALQARLKRAIELTDRYLAGIEALP
jgi:phosphoinositide 3-/4-kinase-like protein